MKKCGAISRSAQASKQAGRLEDGGVLQARGRDLGLDLRKLNRDIDRAGARWRRKERSVGEAKKEETAAERTALALLRDEWGQVSDV